MELGFVSAILPDLALDEVLDFGKTAGYNCVELMCWPAGRAERRYAGVTHVDVAGLDRAAVADLCGHVAESGLSISGLGYYPNPLTPDLAEAEMYVSHLRKVIEAAKMLGVPVVNTFVGRDWTQSVDDNWPRFLSTWKPLIQFADDHGVKIGIENCPMLFTRDEWPGGKNLATSPENLAADVFRHPQSQLRPQLRSLAFRLAADGLPARAAGIRAPPAPHPCQRRAPGPTTG